MMSLLMPLIFALPSGMPLISCILLWPVRWAVAYFLVVIIVTPTAFNLAERVFNFKIN
ncbi:hypothetical protein [uncultured Methanobrevibacter sp.]|uniref:hypothetical protein n=1 Tax=uncultured Methanobrevibacter sp. TaxID=253161 RepID=UPI0026DF753F|nr:hypothetical protein [uncultured Methanobrevibacter sp.]